MKNQLTFIAAVMLLCSCGGSNQRKEITAPPPVKEIPGVALETYLVTEMSSSNRPQNRVDYIGEPVKEFYIYNKFSNIQPGNHVYEYALWPKKLSYSFDPKFNQVANEEEEAIYDYLTGYYSFNVEGTTTQNVWSTIKTWEAVINHGYGEYFFDTYLNGSLVNRIEVPIYSIGKIDSAGLARYWLNDEYFNNISVGPELTKMDFWRQTTLKYLKGEVESIMTPADYKGFKRFFAVQRIPDTKDEFAIVEVKKQEAKEIRRMKTSNVDEVKFHMYQDGDDVYFYNFAKNFNTKYNLEDGSSGPASVPEGINIPAKGVFPSGKTGLSILKSCEDGAVYLVEKGKRTKLADLKCDEDMGWAGWSTDASKVYFDAGGAFEYDIASGVLTQMFYDPNISDVNVFQLENQDLVLFSNGTRMVNVATNLSSVNGMGYFSNEFNYDNIYQMDLKVLEGTPDTLSVTFESPDTLLSSTTGEDMLSLTTEIKQIGQVSEGKYKGYHLLRMDLREDSECKGCEGTPYPKDFMVYLLSGEEKIIFLKSSIDEDQHIGKSFIKNGKVNIRDAGYALNGFDLFSNTKEVSLQPQTVIGGLLSPDQISVEGQTLYLYAKKYKYYGEIDKNFTSIGKTTYGDQVMVLNEEDGAFSIFHPDGSWSVYTYGFTGSLNTDEDLDLDEYVHYTDRYCNDVQIDLSNVVGMDKKLLEEIGTYSGSKIYKLADENTLQVEYENYRKKMEEYEEMSEIEVKSLQDFKASIPFFFWEDQLGRFVQFTHRDYLTPVACEPILYVYPEQAMDVEISVDSKVNLIASYPGYQDGWHVRAEQNGNLIDYKSSAKEHRLFWEGVSDFLPRLKTGFVKQRSEIEPFLNDKLAYLGLNDLEIKEFKEAWLDELTEKEYCFITFYDQAYIDIYAPIEINPKPDQFIRVLMDYKALDKSIEVEAPVLSKAPKREGYVVVEWGGLKR